MTTDIVRRRWHDHLRAFCAAAALLVPGLALSAPTTYLYVGKTYVSPNGAFTTSMRVTGSFTTNEPLPANMSPTAIGPGGDGRAIAWSFNNGIDTFTQSNSVELFGDPSFFVVGTDGSGNITYYNVALVAPPPPHAVNDLLGVVFFSNASNTLQAVNQSACVAVTSGHCTNLPFGSAGWLNESESGGAFLRTSYASVPVDAPGALAGLAALLALAGVFALRRGASGRRAA